MPGFFVAGLVALPGAGTSRPGVVTLRTGRVSPHGGCTLRGAGRRTAGTGSGRLAAPGNYGCYASMPGKAFSTLSLARPVRSAVAWVSTDGHQAGVAAGRRGVHAQGVFDQQALQRDVGLALVEAVHADDGALALGRLLADLAQLVGVAVVQD